MRHVRFLLLAMCVCSFYNQGIVMDLKKENEEIAVTANEDLMREHGILNRVLLIYEELIKQLDTQNAFDSTLLLRATDIIKTFIEEYHEKSEEDYIFPVFRKAKKQLRLVNTLVDQHQAGRKLTGQIREIARANKLENQKERKKVISALRKYIKMYRPHEAREDTVLFPQLTKLISKKEYEELGELFEKIEHEKFGDDGFDKILNDVVAIEKELGIYELSQFTPQN